MRGWNGSRLYGDAERRFPIAPVARVSATPLIQSEFDKCRRRWGGRPSIPRGNLWKRPHFPAAIVHAAMVVGLESHYPADTWSISCAVWDIIKLKWGSPATLPLAASLWFTYSVRGAKGHIRMQARLLSPISGCLPVRSRLCDGMCAYQELLAKAALSSANFNVSIIQFSIFSIVFNIFHFFHILFWVEKFCHWSSDVEVCPFSEWSLEVLKSQIQFNPTNIFPIKCSTEKMLCCINVVKMFLLYVLKL